MGLTLEAINVSDEWFEHHGIKGQKWGVRRTPEQLGHILKKKNTKYYGQYNAAVKRIGEIQGTKTVAQLSPKEKSKMLKATEKAESYLKKMEGTESKYGAKIEKAETRQKAAEEKVTAKEEAERVKNEKLKADIMKKQDWNKAYEHKELFSSQELNELATRINTEKKVKEALEGDSKMDKLADKLKSAANLAGAGYDLYNKVNNIKEVFDEGKKNAAYKEIRQLMADGKTAEVIKRTVDIDDSDLANFEKRNTFLNKLNKQLGTAQPQNNNQQTNQQKTAKDKIKDAIKQKMDDYNSDFNKKKREAKKNAKQAAKEKRALERAQNKYDKKLNEILGAKLSDVVEAQPKYSKEKIQMPVFTVDVDSTANSKNYLTSRIRLREAMNKFEPLVINDVGDYSLNELRNYRPDKEKQRVKNRVEAYNF